MLLPPEHRFLDDEALHLGLGEAARQFRVFQLEDVDSTQQMLRDWIRQEALPSGFCLVARQQRAGQGRRGRVWWSDADASLTFSLWWGLADPPHALSALGLVVSLALVEALEKLGVDAGLKWPNDVMSGVGKAGGVLIHLMPSAQGTSGAVIGIGLNLSLPEPSLAIQQPVARLVDAQGRAPDRAQLLGYVLASLARRLASPRQDWEEDWLARCVHHRQWVSLLQPDGTVVRGQSVGVAASGGLLVRREDGRTDCYHGGEISLRYDTTP